MDYAILVILLINSGVLLTMALAWPQKAETTGPSRTLPIGVETPKISAADILPDSIWMLRGVGKVRVSPNHSGGDRVRYVLCRNMSEEEKEAAGFAYWSRYAAGAFGDRKALWNSKYNNKESWIISALKDGEAERQVPVETWLRNATPWGEPKETEKSPPSPQELAEAEVEVLEAATKKAVKILAGKTI